MSIRSQLVDGATRVVCRVVKSVTAEVPEVEDSAFSDAECVACGESFDVPPDFVFDERRAYYCEQCRRRF